MALAVYVLIAVAVGVAGGMQVLVNANLNKTADLPLTGLVVNMVAGVTMLAVYLLFSRQSFTVLRDADWYAYLGGVLGVIIVLGSTFLIPKLGLTVASSIIIVSQLSFALVADHFGFFSVRQIAVDPIRIIALLVMIVGIYLFFK